MVPLVFGIIGYAAYVYIGRFCIPVVLHPEKGVVLTKAAASMCSSTLELRLVLIDNTYGTV
jgi:hypothetical protein